MKGFAFSFICTFYLSLKIVINVSVTAEQNFMYTTLRLFCHLSCVPGEGTPSFHLLGEPGVPSASQSQPLPCSAQWSGTFTN